MDVNEDTILQDLGIFPEALLLQLHDLAVLTVGDLLGATQGFQQFPSDDPAWEMLFQSVQSIIGAERVLPYQDSLTTPPMGLRILP